MNSKVKRWYDRNCRVAVVTHLFTTPATDQPRDLGCIELDWFCTWMFYHFAEVLPSLRRNRRENEVFGFPGSAYRIGLLCRRRVLLQKLSPPNTRPTDTAGLSAERVFPGCVDCVFLPAEGHFIFTQPGKSILAEPCI